MTTQTIAEQDSFQDEINHSTPPAFCPPLFLEWLIKINLRIRAAKNYQHDGGRSEK